MSAAPDAARGGHHGTFRQSMAWMHTWTGLVLSVVLYFMFVTGTPGYFTGQITRWMEPERGKLTASVLAAAVPHSPEAMADAAYGHVFSESREWKVMTFGWPTRDGASHDFFAIGERHASTKEEEKTASKEFRFDPRTLAAQTGKPVVRETGGGGALYVMHYALHYFPEDSIRIGDYSIGWPTLIVGVATMFMLIALVTGIVVHKKIFADFFTLRTGKGQRSWLDAHNLASVLALPFMVVITYSGLIFYTYQYMPLVKGPVYGFSDDTASQLDKERDLSWATLSEPGRSGRAAVPVRPSVVIAKARETFGSEPLAQIQYQNPGDANARIQVWMQRPGEVGADTLQTLLFDGVTGELLGKPAGADAAGAFANIVIALHVGAFAGPVLRWLYFVTGALGAAMIATGLVLWSAKRRRRNKPGTRADLGFELVDRSNVGIICGLLIAVGVYFWANRLLPVGMSERAAWEIHCLFIAWGLALLHAIARPSARAWTEQFALAALVFGLLPVLNVATTDIHLGHTLFVAAGDQDLTLASVDLVALGIGLIFGFLAWRRSVRPANAITAGPKQAAPVSGTGRLEEAK